MAGDDTDLAERERQIDERLRRIAELVIGGLRERKVSLPGIYPNVMVPAFAVPSSILLHVLSLRQLRRRSR